MSRNFELLMQVIVNGFTPLLLLTPLAVVLLSKFNPPDEAARTEAQKLFKLLCLFFRHFRCCSGPACFCLAQWPIPP